MNNNNEEKLLSAIFNIGRSIREEIHTSNCLVNFTQAEIEVLKFLHSRKDTTMKSVADYLHIKPSSATPIIDSLVKKGDIKRIQKKGDRRVVCVEITTKGAGVLQKKYKKIHKTIKKVFGKLNDNDKKTLIKIFEKIHV
ncbi:MAG: MarR family transcriptional regulator [Candidatus Staskawiczbacteria bacterium]|nr:MarR family transcriptional regulator [Candidatus Staskawiczbacteria bacterium]